MKVLSGIVAVMMSGCSLLLPSPDKTESFIEKETIVFNINIGVDSSLDVGRGIVSTASTQYALENLKEELNIQFNIKDITTVEFPHISELSAAKCLHTLDPKQSDNTLNLCIVKGVINPATSAVGVYVAGLKTALVTYNPSHFFLVNTIRHEIGHFLGSDHAADGVMTSGLGESATKGVIPFSNHSVKEIRIIHRIKKVIRDVTGE